FPQAGGLPGASDVDMAGSWTRPPQPNRGVPTSTANSVLPRSPTTWKGHHRGRRRGSQAMKNLLITGPPACGKTTLVLRLIERLPAPPLAAFYPAEVREGGHRVGFAAIGLSTGTHAILAHIRSKSRLRVGRYGVEPAALAPLVEAELGRPAAEVG